MKRILVPASVGALALFASLALAETAPPGWVTTDDGPKHEITGIVCPEELGGFEFATVAVDGNAAMLGRCHYPKSPETEAWLRIREYVKGQGESGMAIQNDETLMHPKPGEDAPISTFRVTPGETGDGRRYSDFVITARVGDLLVDCIGRTNVSNEAASQSSQDFVLACSNLVDEAK